MQWCHLLLYGMCVLCMYTHNDSFPLIETVTWNQLMETTKKYLHQLPDYWIYSRQACIALHVLWFPVLYLCFCCFLPNSNGQRMQWSSDLHIWTCRKIHSATESLRPFLKTGWGISALMNLWTCFQSSVRRLPENSRPYMPSKYMVIPHKTVICRLSSQKWYDEMKCVCRFQCG